MRELFNELYNSCQYMFCEEVSHIVPNIVVKAIVLDYKSKTLIRTFNLHKIYKGPINCLNKTIFTY